jgi:hypothetical protein
MTHSFPKPLIVILALLQGIALTLLYRSVEQHFWPATDLPWLFALLTFSISFPFLMLMSINSTNLKRTINVLLPFALVLSLLGAYVGFQSTPADMVENQTGITAFYLCMFIAVFKGLMYAQHYINQQSISYSTLFKLSWQNFIIFVECWLFVGIFWGILNLGASLFAIVNITQFETLLDQDWFVIPTLTLAFSFAIILFRQIVHTADTITTILQTLIKFLLPALAVVSIGFMFTLPFTGLSPLWMTGSGSLIVMWLQALTLFFVNAVYQDKTQQRPYPLFVHRMVFISVAILPIYSVIAAYGLWLRIAEYGVTVDRCWGLLVWFLLSCFAVGYLFGILKDRDAWLSTLSRVNIFMGKVVLAAMLLVNSPLLNFQTLSMQSQLNRLYAKEVTLDEFDFHYVERTLGRQGYIAMQTLKTQLGDEHPQHVAVIERMYGPKFSEHTGYAQTEFENHIIYWPTKNHFPAELITTIYEQKGFASSYAPTKQSYYLIAQDLDHDGQPEFIEVEESNYSTDAYFWVYQEDKWQSSYMNTFNRDNTQFLKRALQNNQISAERPKYDNLKIGEVTFTPPQQ